jgi:uncharacterized protein (UPF0210 family)
MKLRSLTYFLEPGNPIDEPRIAAAGKFLASARATLQGAGYEVQTSRLALPAFDKTFTEENIEEAVKYAQNLETYCFVHGIDVASLGVVRPTDPASFFEIIPDVLGNTQNIFASAIMASPLNGISLTAIHRIAHVIQRNSTLTPDGLGNGRFSALANVEPGVPFFPTAYHEGGTPTFAIATEAADLAVQAFTAANTLTEAHTNLVNALEEHGKKLQAAVRKITGIRAVKFSGIDFSLAPYPNKETSIGAALEALGVPVFGGSGTVAAAAFVTDAISKAKFPRAGFSGLFLPVMEDTVLAARAAEGTLTINDLLLFSTVCGTGLDTIPLPGDITPAELAPILLDVAAVAMRHNKALTARLMPIPGKKAGDEISFESPYFASGRVMAAKTHPLLGALGGAEMIEIAGLR